MNDIILQGVYNNYSLNLFKSDDFIVSKIINLTWGENELALSTNPYYNGDKVQNERGLPRDITIELKPRKDKGDFSKIINNLSKLIGEEVVLTWKNQPFDNTTDDWLINGIINEFEAPRFEDDVRVTFIVHCSNPYWRGKTKIVENSVNHNVTIKGTAPTKIDVHISNATIPTTNVTVPAGMGVPSLSVIGSLTKWIFNSPNTTVTGNVWAIGGADNTLTSGMNLKSVCLIVGSLASGTKRLDLIKSPMKAVKPGNLTVDYYHPDHTNESGLYHDYLDFTVYYQPMFY